MTIFVDFTEMAETLEAEAAYLAKWVDENEGSDVDTVPVEYAIQSIYEIAHSLRLKSTVRAEVAMAFLGDEIDD